jgi:hypothetical protein
MRRWFHLSLLIIVLLCGWACNPITTSSSNGSPQPLPTSSAIARSPQPEVASPPGLIPDDVIQRLQQKLAAQLQISAQQLRLKEATPITWNDACLGLPRPDELCAQMITPGYRFIFSYDQNYEVRSDRTGRIIRVNKVLSRDF